MFNRVSTCFITYLLPTKAPITLLDVEGVAGVVAVKCSDLLTPGSRVLLPSVHIYTVTLRATALQRTVQTLGIMFIINQVYNHVHCAYYNKE